MAVRLDSIQPYHRPRVLAGGGLQKPAVTQVPSPNQNDRPGGSKDITAVVLHHTSGGTLESNANHFKNPSAQVSSHYIVGKDGRIVQSVADGKRAWHAGTSEFKGRSDVNSFSLGIEIVNAGTGSDPFPDSQYKAIIDLVAWMCQTYNIPVDRITGHKDVALPRGRKNDPALNFDWGRVRSGVEAKLKGGSAPAKSEPKPAPKPAVKPTAPSGDQGLYAVKDGDTLYGIAKRLLGDGTRWPELYELNKDKIKDPNVIYPGMVLRLSADSAAKPEAPKAPDLSSNPIGALPQVPGTQPKPPVTKPPVTKPAPQPVAPGEVGLAGGLRIGGSLAQNYLNPGAASGGSAGGFMNGGLLNSVPGLLKRNFAVAAVVSGVTNLMDFIKGRTTGKQAAAGFAADTVAYTGIGAASTAIGAAVGSVLGPVGTIGGFLVGSAVGVGLGWAYEKFGRSKIVSAIAGFLGK